jgi:hypothetical protein
MVVSATRPIRLTNYNVEIGVSDNAGSLAISLKMDVGFHVYEPEND